MRDHAPWFVNPDQFDQKRIRLTDIDGSGVTDIIYLKADGPHIYFNHSGNDWSQGRRLDHFPAIDNLSVVMAVDLLSPRDYQVFAMRYVQQLISEIKRKEEPVIYFPKGVHYLMHELKEIGADTISVDWTMELEKVRRKMGDKVAIQGNLDPTVLYADPSFIKREARKVLESFGKGHGHIFNLGHGILPDIDPENVKVLVNYVKEESAQFHTAN